MQKFLSLLFCFTAPFAFAGPPQVIATSQPETLQPVPIDYIETEMAYVFESDVNHGGSFGKSDLWQNEFEYGHRFLLSGNWYLHGGVSYNRFDLGRTAAPIPIHLQNAEGVFGIDYMRGQDLGAFIQFRPGIYTEEAIGSRSFDCPITLARFWVVRDKELYILTGATGSFLRGGFPVIPLVGIVWTPNQQWRLMAIPPEPKLIYSASKQLDVWVGGEVTGGSFRTDDHPDYRLQVHDVKKLSGAVLDFADYRAGVGFTYSPTRQVDVDFSGGCSVLRQFDYSRAGETYRTDPAPYVRLEIKARF